MSVKKKVGKKVGKKESTARKFESGSTLMVDVKMLAIDRAMQQRSSVTKDAVDDYAEQMDAGKKFPAIEVVSDGVKHWVVDGFHRVLAAKKSKKHQILCHVVNGSKEDAIWSASAANLLHGVRRSNSDKRKAVAMALSVKPSASLREIADHCSVSHTMIAQIKREMEAVEDIEVEASRSSQEMIENKIVDEENEVALAMVAAEDVINTVVELTESVALKAKALVSTKHGVFVNGQSLATDLSNAKSGLKQGMPYKQCPLCVGEGCSTCRKAGWVSRRQWDLIPKSQRKEA